MPDQQVFKHPVPFDSVALPVLEFSVGCIALIVIIVIIFLVFLFVLEFVIEFFPSVLIAGLTWWLSGGDLIWTIIAFVVSAIFFAFIGHTRRRRTRG
jgi:uncharacterized membrane protein